MKLRFGQLLLLLNQLCRADAVDVCHPAVALVRVFVKVEADRNRLPLFVGWPEIDVQQSLDETMYFDLAAA